VGPGGVSMPGCMESRIQGGKKKVQLFQGRGEGGHDDDGIKNGAGEQAVGAGDLADDFSVAFGGWEAFAIRAAELDAGDESTLADFVNDGVLFLKNGQAGGEEGYFFLQPLQRVLFPEKFQAGQGCARRGGGCAGDLQALSRRALSLRLRPGARYDDFLRSSSARNRP